MAQRKRLDDFDSNSKLADQLAAEFENRPKMIKKVPITEYHPVAEKLGELMAARNNKNVSQFLITTFIKKLDPIVRLLDTTDPNFGVKLTEILTRPIMLDNGEKIHPYPDTSDLLWLRDCIEHATGVPVSPDWYINNNIPIEEVVQARLDSFIEVADASMSDYDRGYAEGYKQACRELNAQKLGSTSDGNKRLGSGEG